MQRQTSGADAGFTLIEIMVVVTILGLLATLVVANVLDSADRARHEKALADVHTICTAARLYRLEHGRTPSIEELRTPDDRGRVAIEELPADPWGRAYVLREGERMGHFEVLSAGPDGQLDTPDDIPDPDRERR